MITHTICMSLALLPVNIWAFILFNFSGFQIPLWWSVISWYSNERHSWISSYVCFLFTSLSWQLSIIQQLLLSRFLKFLDFSLYMVNIDFARVSYLLFEGCLQNRYFSSVWSFRNLQRWYSRCNSSSLSQILTASFSFVYLIFPFSCIPYIQVRLCSCFPYSQVSTASILLIHNLVFHGYSRCRFPQRPYF